MTDMENEKLHNRAVLPWGPVSLAFMGVAFARLWLSLVFVEPSVGSGALALPHDVFDWGYTLLNVAFAVCARRLVPLSNRASLYVLALAFMLAASACSVVSMWFAVPRAVAVVAALAGGGAYALFLLLNAEAFAGVSILRIVVYLSGSRLLASLLAFLLATVDPVRMTVVLLASPLVAVVLVRAAYRSLPAADRQRRAYPRFAMPWKLLVVMAVFSFAYGLRQTSLADGAGQHSSVSTAIVMGIVLVLAYYFSNSVDLARLCRLPLPIMVCGLLLVPAEGLFGQAVSSYLVSMAYTLVNFSISILLYDMSKRTGVAIVPLMAALHATQAFIVLGNYVSRAFDALFAGGALADAVVACLVVAALVVSFLLLFSERELAARWGIKVLETSSLGDESGEVDRLAARCDELVRIYGLTAREDEVLRELARRKNSQDIARNLCIAPGTLKAHTRHIYEKMGIHTRVELAALLGIDQ